MQIDELMPPAFTSAYPVTQPDDPYVADLLQLADGRSGGRVLVGRLLMLLQLPPKLFYGIFRIHELQEDIIKLKLDLENAQECVKHLNTQVRNQVASPDDQEIHFKRAFRWRSETKRSSVSTML